MHDDFRRRVAAPVLMLLAVLVGIALFAFSISRVLLAVPEIVATISALAIAGYVLLIGGLVSKQRRVTPQALAGGLVIGFVAVLAAGVVAAQAGMRDLHHDEEEGTGDTETAEPAGIPQEAHVWVADDVVFSDAPETIPAGEVVIAIDNQGGLPHTVTFEEAEVDVVADGEEQAWDTYTLEPGTYTYFCDIPGHRSTMEGTVEVQ